MRDGGEPNRFARGLFSGLGPRYDALGALLSLGQDRRWRREAVSQVVAGATQEGPVLDVATGTAGLALQILARSGARVVGVDLTEGMLRQGAANVAAAGATGRVSLVRARAEQLPFRDGTFSGLTFSYLLRYVEDPAATVAEMARVIRPGAPMRGWWWLYTRLVLPLGGLVTGGREWFRVGRFLGPNITGHYRRYPLGWTVQAWSAAGLSDVGTRLMSLGGGLVMWGRKAR